MSWRYRRFYKPIAVIGENHNRCTGHSPGGFRRLRRSVYKIVKCFAGLKKLEKVDSDVYDVMKEDITLSLKDVIVGVSAWKYSCIVELLYFSGKSTNVLALQAK